MEEYQMMVKTIISTYKENGKVELTDFLTECLEKCLEDSFKYTDCRKEGLKMEKNQFTIGNDDNIDKAVEGLGRFCHNYCMNCKETEKINDLVFRCGECVFQMEDGTCLIKKFIFKNCKGDYCKYTSMGSL